MIMVMIVMPNENNGNNDRHNDEDNKVDSTIYDHNNDFIYHISNSSIYRKKINRKERKIKKKEKRKQS